MKRAGSRRINLPGSLSEDIRLKKSMPAEKRGHGRQPTLSAGSWELNRNGRRGFEEISFGKWEGYTWKQVKETFPEEYLVWQKNRRYQVPPMGESYQQLLGRLLPALDDIIRREGRIRWL